MDKLTQVMLIYLLCIIMLTGIGCGIGYLINKQEKDGVTGAITGFVIGAILSLVLWLIVGKKIVYPEQNS